METIDLHGYNQQEARELLERRLQNAAAYGERVVRIVHGQGKHSEVFPVLKSFVRRWLEESDLAAMLVAEVYRGEDGSPYTLPNAGETILVLKGAGTTYHEPQLNPDDEEEYEARRQAKAIMADRLRVARRRRRR
ncbi:MAG TPA: Smr/MutS family protein [Bacillota bacterium]